MTEYNEMSKGKKWAGYIISGVAAIFLLIDAVMKFVQPAEVVSATEALGYDRSVILPLGIILLVSVILYIFPRTTVLGAILLTGYLGGAVATHVRLSNPVFSHVLVPVYFGIFIWLGLWLRKPLLRGYIPLRSIFTTDRSSAAMLWTGRLVSSLPILMLLFSALMKIFMPMPNDSPEMQASGWTSEVLLKVGVVELVCTLIYIIPKTSIFGAILLTGYLGGAVATHVRTGDGMFFVPFAFGVLLWLGQWMRERPLNKLVPLTN